LVVVVLGGSALAGHRTGEHRPLMTAAAEGTSGGGSGGGGGGGNGGGNEPSVTVTTPTVPEPKVTVPATRRPTSTTTTTKARPTPDPDFHIAIGERTECPGDSAPNVRCYDAQGSGDIDAVVVPDGRGGSITIPVEAGPLSFTGGGSSNDTDIRVEVNIDNGDTNVVNKDGGRQALLATIAMLLLVLIGVAVYATMKRRGLRLWPE
jgi:hypothetical protein